MSARRALQGQRHPLRGRAGSPQSGQDCPGGEISHAIHSEDQNSGASALSPAPARSQEGRRDAGAAAPRGVPLSKHIYAQLVDDQRGVTLAGATDTSEGVQVEGKGKVARSFAVGRLIAAKAKEKGIAKVVFDRGGYQYHGRVKAVADGAARRPGVLMDDKKEETADFHQRACG